MILNILNSIYIYDSVELHLLIYEYFDTNLCEDPEETVLTVMLAADRMLNKLGQIMCQLPSWISVAAAHLFTFSSWLLLCNCFRKHLLSSPQRVEMLINL